MRLKVFRLGSFQPSKTQKLQKQYAQKLRENVRSN